MLPVPACQRAVIVAKEALLRAGHILVPFSVPNVENAIDISNAGKKFKGFVLYVLFFKRVYTFCLLKHQSV